MNCSKCGGVVTKSNMDVVMDTGNGQKVYKHTPVYLCKQCGEMITSTSLTDSTDRLGDKEILLEGGVY